MRYTRSKKKMPHVFSHRDTCKKKTKRKKKPIKAHISEGAKGKGDRIQRYIRYIRVNKNNGPGIVKGVRW